MRFVYLYYCVLTIHGFNLFWRLRLDLLDHLTKLASITCCGTYPSTFILSSYNISQTVDVSCILYQCFVT